MVNIEKNEFNPDVVFPPGDTLLETIETLDMTQAELASRMKVSEKHVNLIIKGKATITEETALKLERVLGIPASFWRNLEHQYRRYLAEKEERERLNQKKEWLSRFPVKEMCKLGWITYWKDSVKQLTELLNFFGVANWESWENIWTKEAAFRKSEAFQSDPYAVAAWLRKGELLAREIKCAPFNKKEFKEILTKIRCLSREDPSVFLPKLPQICAKYGVAVVYLPELSGIRISGVSRWLSKNKALIQLSARYKSDDHFWFTFFHEAGHLLLHGKREVFIENDISYQKNPKEEEANKFAADILIPPKKYKKFLRENPKPTILKIKKFAEELNISPGIVVGRLQHDKIISFNSGNKLKKKVELIHKKVATN